MHQDSTGQTLVIGDRVRWRGKEYTIHSFPPGPSPSSGFPLIKFEEKPHTTEIPDEVAVDFVSRSYPIGDYPMNCQFCDTKIHAETQGGTRMCDNCWELERRIASVSIQVLNRIVKHARAHIRSKPNGS